MSREASDISTVILQTATVDFDGTLPTASAVLTPEGLYRYPDEANGGLFYWDGVREPMVIYSFLCTLVSGDATLSLVNLDDNDVPIAGEEFQLAAGIGVTMLNLPLFGLIVLQKQALKLVTTTAAVAEVCGSIERMARR